MIGGGDLATLLLGLVPFVLGHCLAPRWCAWQRFQLLVDLGVLVSFASALAAGLHLGPGAPRGGVWNLPQTVGGSPEQLDLPLQFAVFWDEVRRLVAEGYLPWVSDRLGGGTPLFAHGQSGVPFPLQLPVWLLGSRRGTDVIALWKLELAAAGSYLLLHRVRVRPVAASAGSLAYSFGLYLLSWLVVPLSWVVAAAPWAVRFLIGTLRGNRVEAAMLAAVLGILTGWSTHPETAVFLLLAVAAFGVALGWGRVRRIRRLALPVFLSALVAGVGAVPTLAAIRESSKLSGLRDPEYRRLDPGFDWRIRGLAVALMVVPWVRGHPADGTWHERFPAAPASNGVGTIAIVFLLTGRCRRRHRRLFLATAMVGGLAVALVIQVPLFTDIAKTIPVLGVMIWVRAAFLIGFAVALLAALKIDAWIRQPNRRRLSLAAAAVQLAVLAVVWGGVGPGALGRVLESAWVPAGVAALAAAPAPAIGWVLPGAVLVEQLLLSRDLVGVAAPSTSPLSSPLAEELSAGVREEGGRIIAAFEHLPANLSAVLGYSDLRLNDPVRSRNLARLHGTLGSKGADLPGPITTPSAPLAGAWGVRWCVAPPSARDDGWTRGWEAVLRTDAGDLYRNPRALPILRIATEVAPATEEPRPGGYSRVDFTTTALVAEPLYLGGDGGIDLIEQRPERVRAQVVSRGRVLALLHVPLAPGWRAYIDGRPAPLLLANVAAMAVVVDEGVHEIEWRYRPPGLAMGLALTVLGLMGCAFLALGRTRGWRSEP